MKVQAPNEIAAFDRLALSADLAEALCGLSDAGQLVVAKSLQEICTLLGVALARAGEVEKALRDGESVGLFRKVSENRWSGGDRDMARRLRPLLEGVALYKARIHRDENLVDLVLTKPSAPSKMATELEQSLAGSWGIRDTLQLLPAIAESASKALTVVSPFLDDVGATVVENLFARSKAPRGSLILRSGPDGLPPPGLKMIRTRLTARNVEVLNFRIERQDASGFETFHAKVILADDHSAYLGSANMQRWSFEYSLELGFYVRGRAAARLADVVAAIRAVSAPFP